MPLKHPYVLASALIPIITTGLIFSPFGSATFFAFAFFAFAYLALGIPLIATGVIAFMVHTARELRELESEDNDE